VPIQIAPQVLSLLICDQIIIDRLTGKTSLIGIFGSIGSTTFPMRHPQLCVFASLNDGRGKTPLDIHIVDTDEQREPVVTGRAVVEFKDPRAIAFLNLHFSGLVFPQPGEYRLQLSSNGELLREVRLELVQAVPRKPTA
jgi:hypothetical protein